jgi:hypothetical protein
MSLSLLFHVQESAGLNTWKLARGHQGLSRSFRYGRGVHDHAKRDHVLLAFVQKCRAALLGSEREPQVPAPYVLDPCQFRNENVLHCYVFHKWNVIAVHDVLGLPPRRRPARPPSGKNDVVLNYHKLIVWAANDSDRIVTFRALPLRQVAAP